MAANLAGDAPRGAALSGESSFATTAVAPVPVRAPEQVPESSEAPVSPQAAPAGREAKIRRSRSSAAPVSAVTRAKPAPPASAGTATGVTHRHHAGAVLRGYRIPAPLHRRAERAKLAASAERGAQIHWDELLQSAIDAMPDDLATIAAGLPKRDGRAAAAGPTKVLQAAIRADQDLKLRLMRLDLEDLGSTSIRLEDLWTWLVARVILAG